MAYANNFVVKNGLTVGTTQIANSQGHWTGQQISFVSVPLSGADATQNNQIQAAFNQANVTVGIDATQNLAITYANTTVNTLIGIDATQNLAITYANTTVNTIIGIDATQNLAIASAYTRANNSLNANTGGTVTGDVTITGNLIVSGVTTTVNTSTINVTDSLIKLANNNVVGDTLDIGFYGQSNNSTNVVYHGLVRRAGADFFLFKNLTSDPTSNILATGSLTATNTATLRANLNGGMISGLANSIGILDGGTGSSTFNNNQLVFYSGATSNIVSLANAIIATTSSSNGTFVPVITVDPFGRVTSVSNTAIDTTYVSSAYFQANSANILAQAAFNQANSANILAQAAFNQANSANILAQAAFNQANSANILAQAAFNQANVTVGIDATQNLAITYANTTVNTLIGIDATQNLAITYANNTVNAVLLSAYSSANIANISYVTASTYGSSGAVPVVTVAANGRITSISTASVSGLPTLTDDTTSAGPYYPAMFSVTSGTPAATYLSSTKLYYNPTSGTLNATNFNSLSDVNRKENITTLSSALNKVLSLRGVSYNWKDTHEPSIGLIAQEVESVIPELVFTNDKGEKGVTYGNIVGLLIEAVKEQQRIIEELGRKVKDLENK